MKRKIPSLINADTVERTVNGTTEGHQTGRKPRRVLEGSTPKGSVLSTDETYLPIEDVHIEVVYTTRDQTSRLNLKPVPES